MPSSKWTARDLRRTVGTLMSQLRINGDVIDECLNHKIESRVRRIYFHDRSAANNVRSFYELVTKLAELTSTAALAHNALPA
jgi:integrase